MKRAAPETATSTAGIVVSEDGVSNLPPGVTVQGDVANLDDQLIVTPLGSGNEVGRSCVVVKFKGKTVMFDCGVHPALNGYASLPFFDEIDPAEIDLLLVTHFHLDHCAAVPYFLEKTNFKGRCFMTHPSKAIYKLLLSDFVKVSHVAVEDMLYTDKDVSRSMDKIELVNYHEEVEHHGIKFWCYNAGHVLGAAMWMVEISGVKILYTGDFSRQEDRHLMGAENPAIPPDVLIVESTYGVQVHEPRKERESRFTKVIHDVVGRGGRCLLPVFALGRAQELLLILDEYWQAHRELHQIPVYYASSLAKKAMAVYQTYINMMNERIRAAFDVSNPFVFKHISNLKSMDHFDDNGPSVVMASPGMLQSGLSRELFELWCSDERNGVVIPGYCVEGTLAKHIMSEPKDINTLDGRTVPLKLDVHYISFSAHSDFLQTSQFIEGLMPPNIVLVHGDGNEMQRLKGALLQKFHDQKMHIHTPANCADVVLQYRGETTAKVVGTLAEEKPDSRSRKRVKGLLVRKDFNHTILDPTELSKYTQLTSTSIKQRLVVPFQQMPFTAVVTFLNRMFAGVRVIPSRDRDSHPRAVVNGTVDIIGGDEQVAIEWESTTINDVVADSVIALLMQVQTSAGGASTMHASAHGHHSHVHDEEAVASILTHHFESVERDPDDPDIPTVVTDNGVEGVVVDGELESEDPALTEKATKVIRQARQAVEPIPF